MIFKQFTYVENRNHRRKYTNYNLIKFIILKSVYYFN